jgi:hypothetical protein
MVKNGSKKIKVKPLPKSRQLTENVDNVPYQHAIGSLMYLAVCTRPDISFAMTYLSQFNNCYTMNKYLR